MERNNPNCVNVVPLPFRQNLPFFQQENENSGFPTCIFSTAIFLLIKLGKPLCFKSEAQGIFRAENIFEFNCRFCGVQSSKN